MADIKNINYLQKDFPGLRDMLIQLAKTYYPDSYSDFTAANPGSMFIDIAAATGDVLSFYTDQQLRETLLDYAQEKKNVLNIARTIGYKPKLSVPSYTTLDVYQLVPSILSGSSYVPDMRYALNISPKSKYKSNTGIDFICDERIQFSISGSNDPLDITVYSVDGNNQPDYFLLKKKAKVYSATTKTVSYSVTSPQKYYKILLTDNNLIGVSNVIDTNNNEWTEVPYLAQNTIFESVTNTSTNDPDYISYNNQVPYLLKLKTIPYRFITRVLNDNTIELQFGSGATDSPDEELIPNPDNVGSPLVLGTSKLDISYDPTNFIYTKSYGAAPSNTSLTVTYLVGGGIKSNLPSNTINKITSAVDESGANSFSNSLYTKVYSSLACNNPLPCVGGRDAETIDEIRQNAMAIFNTQNRTVTKEDYAIRVLAMPSKFGSVAKVYVSQDEQQSPRLPGVTIHNPYALNLYCLGYDNNKNLCNLNTAIKDNLRTYISQYKLLTDSIIIKDAYIVNINVMFDVVPLPGYNSNEVLLRCIDTVKSYFNIDNWSINQPIIKNELITTLASVKGVQSVVNINIRNVTGNNYSPFFYDLSTAERNGVIYPSLDPCIFELKNPLTDIKGRIISN